jgi:hypothetical protein
VLTRFEIEGALTALAERLAAEGARLRIHIVGSAALVLAGFDRPYTHDVDAAFSSNERVIAVAREIAEERGWAADWLNDKVTQFLPDHGTPEWEAVIRRGGVVVLIAPRDLMFAMKLHAGRGRRDGDDVRALVTALGIGTVAQARAVFESYYPHDELKPTSARWLTQLLRD